MKEVFDGADFVVIGTGAGGATAARTLSLAGFRVVMLEEGGEIDRSANLPLLPSMAEAMRDFGAQATASTTPMPLLQGCVVGGSTAINSGIIWRMPDDVRASWRREHGLAELVDDVSLDDAFARIEGDLGVERTRPDQLGGNSEAMARGAAALGLPGQAMLRNASACVGSARCLSGCPDGARRSMDVSYVPDAVAAGARLHAHARADKILVERGRAVGIDGTLLEPVTRRRLGRIRVLGRLGVVVAAGTLHSPLLLLRLGLRGLVGKRFQAHPGAAVVGRFPDPINMGFGATQGYEVPMRAEGFKLESLSLPPELLVTRIPGAGADWQERLSALNHFTQWVVQARMEAHGQVRRGWGGRPSVSYEPTARDLGRIRTGIALLCRMMFEAGASEVYPSLGGIPDTLTDPSQVALIEHLPLRRRDYHLLASHLFGTCSAGATPARSVVAPNLEAHEVPGLFVMDASVFPTNMGVNPQHSIMAVVDVAARRLANVSRHPARPAKSSC